MNDKTKNLKFKKSILTTISLLITFAFSKILFGFESASNNFFSNSHYSGHEEITRQALNNTAKKIKETDINNKIFTIESLNFDLNPEPNGLLGYKSKNMVIHGNFASDFPSQTKIMSLMDFWNNSDFGEFQAPDVQVNHFLRNHMNEYTVASAKETCLLAREKIKYITLKALEAWNSGDVTRTLFLIGHASHTIQDSFSTAHTVRGGESENYNLKNICYFGENIKKHMDYKTDKLLCYHETPDTKDAIWISNKSQYAEALKNWQKENSAECDMGKNYPASENDKQACMSNEARLARIASERYFLLVFNQLKPEKLIKKSKETFVPDLDNYLFDGSIKSESTQDDKMALGILRCDDLSDQRIEGNPFLKSYKKRILVFRRE